MSTAFLADSCSRYGPERNRLRLQCNVLYVDYVKSLVVRHEGASGERSYLLLDSLLGCEVVHLEEGPVRGPE